MCRDSSTSSSSLLLLAHNNGEPRFWLRLSHFFTQNVCQCLLHVESISNTNRSWMRWTDAAGKSPSKKKKKKINATKNPKCWSVSGVFWMQKMHARYTHKLHTFALKRFSFFFLLRLFFTLCAFTSSPLNLSQAKTHSHINTLEKAQFMQFLCTALSLVSILLKFTIRARALLLHLQR